MNLKCRFHNNEMIERICASSRWKMEPALCWQCMVDQADHVKDHKENIVKIDEFISRIAKEFQVLYEQRKKEAKYAFPEYVKLVMESDYNNQSFRYIVEKRKIWITDVIQKIVNEFTNQCAQLQEQLFELFEEKVRHFEEQGSYVKSCIESRYGLAPLPDVDVIREKLQQIADNDEDCNPYIRDLKDMLLPPLDLEKNLSFQESLMEFEQFMGISEHLTRQIEEQAKQSQQKLDSQIDQQQSQQKLDSQIDQQQSNEQDDILCVEILAQAKEQCSVLIDEVRVAIQSREPILSKKIGGQAQRDVLNESNQTLVNNIVQQGQDLYQSTDSKVRSTYAKKLYETSPLRDASNRENPFLSYAGSSLRQQKQQQQLQDSPIKVMNSESKIQLDCKIRTEQTKGITSIVQVGADCFATGSKDKTIRINFIKAPHENFSLVGHVDQVIALTMFNGRVLISGGGNLDSSLIVWSLSTQKQVHQLKGHQSGVTCIMDLNDGVSCISGSYDNHAIIWNVNEGEAVCALRKHTAMVSCIGLTQRRDHILTGSWDRSIGLWEIHHEPRGRIVKGAKYLREIKTEGAVLCLQMVGDRLVAYGGTNNKVSMMDWFTGEIKRKFQTSQFGICELLLRDSLLIGLGGSDSAIRVWDLNDQDGKETVHRDPNNIFINNNNTNPKMIDAGQGRLGLINNSDKNVHFDIYRISI